MQVINWQVGLRKLEVNNLAAIIGNFDGVHQGHKKLINYARKISSKNKLNLAVLTFNPHPREYFSKFKDFFLIQSNEEKIRELGKLKIDYLINLKFDNKLSSYGAEEFIREIICEKLNIKHVIVGKDFLFGKNRTGDINLLEKVGEKIKLSVSTFKIIEHNKLKISSTRIRDYLKSGKIELANKSLGRNFSISGLVVHGDKRGRSLNFPTANIKLNKLVKPVFGVYAVYVSGLNFKKKLGIANIGKRPTVNFSGELLEVHLFEENLNLYGKELTVEFIKYIRPEKKFNGLDELKTQIKIDVDTTKRFFEKLLD